MADRKLLYKIPAAFAGHKVLEFLTSKGYSRGLQTILKKDPECVLVNGEESFLNRILNEGDELFIWIKELTSSEKIPPVDLPVNIVYEDEDIVVVDKPAKMPIHPSMKNYENTLGNALAYRYRSQGDQFVYRCINRLDRDTTGLTVIAKHMLSACALYDQMVGREIKRTYLAIVEGIFAEGCVCEGLDSRVAAGVRFADGLGVIDLPLGRKPDSAIERMVDLEAGERAVTHFEVLAAGGGMSFLKLNLETGRTHQIRVHMTAIGHPLIGDFLYNPDNRQMTRQALHAGELILRHPVTGEQMTFKAPLPEDMSEIVSSIDPGVCR